MTITPRSSIGLFCLLCAITYPVIVTETGARYPLAPYFLIAGSALLLL
jgi:hypothetical protein